MQLDLVAVNHRCDPGDNGVGTSWRCGGRDADTPARSKPGKPDLPALPERFARIALLCLPEDQDRQSLLAEIIEIKADEQDAAALDAIENDDDEAVLEVLFGLDVDIPTLVVRLCEACELNIVNGYHRSAERLARRAGYEAVSGR